MINLKQLAAELGLSPTTVSRALNGYPEVSEATRRRVVETATRRGYQPNRSAIRLATGKSHAIGHVLPIGGDTMLDPHFTDFLAGAGTYFGARGYDLILSASAVEREADTYRRFKAGRQVDGVVVHSPHENDYRVALLRDLDLPFIVHGRAGVDDDGYNWLDIDNQGAFYKATRLLIELGHRRIVLLNGLQSMTFAQHRLKGFQAARAEAGIGHDGSVVSSLPMTEENGYREMHRMLNAAPRPTAVLCASTLSAFGAIRAIRGTGLSVPDDISVVAHDDGLPFLKAEGLSPPLTTTRSSIRAAGERVAELLIHQIDNPKAPFVGELWEAELIVRGSTARPPIN